MIHPGHAKGACPGLFDVYAESVKPDREASGEGFAGAASNGSFFVAQGKKVQER